MSEEMCQAWKEQRECGERIGRILGTIIALRNLNFVEDKIKEEIMDEFSLTEEEASDYLTKKPSWISN